MQILLLCVLYNRCNFLYFYPFQNQHLNHFRRPKTSTASSAKSGPKNLVQISKFHFSLILIQVSKIDGCNCPRCTRPYVAPGRVKESPWSGRICIEILKFIFSIEYRGGEATAAGCVAVHQSSLEKQDWKASQPPRRREDWQKWQYLKWHSKPRPKPQPKYQPKQQLKQRTKQWPRDGLGNILSNQVRYLLSNPHRAWT